MEIGFLAPYPTDAALVAVVNAFLFAPIVVKRAYFAEVLCEIHITLLTSPLLGLFSAAAQTLDSRAFLARKLMVFLEVHARFVHLFVVAETAWVEFAIADWVGTLL